METATAWSAWPLFSGEPIPIADPHGIVLLGDAAHPVLPFIAQGAALAIEDAAVLAAEIATRDAAAEAIRAYMSARSWNGGGACSASRRGTAASIISAVLPRLPGNAGLHLARGSALLASYDWLYGWRRRLARVPKQSSAARAGRSSGRRVRSATGEEVAAIASGSSMPSILRSAAAGVPSSMVPQRVSQREEYRTFQPPG